MDPVVLTYCPNCKMYLPADGQHVCSGATLDVTEARLILERWLGTCDIHE